MKQLIMVVFGIALAAGGIKWILAADSLYQFMPEVVVEDDFSLTVTPGEKISESSYIWFPAIMGIIGAIVWIICGFKYAGESFPGAICMAVSIMCIPIGILNFLRGLISMDGMVDFMKEVQYPSPVLQYLFVYHRKISIFIFAAVVLLFRFIGKALIERSYSPGKR
jgi:uncharacterized membrane protein YccF (DUF307 family)